MMANFVLAVGERQGYVVVIVPVRVLPNEIETVQLFDVR